MCMHLKNRITQRIVSQHKAAYSVAGIQLLISWKVGKGTQAPEKPDIIAVTKLMSHSDRENTVCKAETAIYHFSLSWWCSEDKQVRRLKHMGQLSAFILNGISLNLISQQQARCITVQYVSNILFGLWFMWAITAVKLLMAHHIFIASAADPEEQSG